MSRFLVTGGAGFIGSNLVEFLVAEGADVRVLDNLSTGFEHNLAPVREHIEFIQGDIRSLDDCRRATAQADYVLHQAALPSVPRSIDDPITSHEVNITGTLNILIAARDTGVKRVVYAASSAAYGDIPVEFKQESLLPAPLSPYAANKLAGEYYLKVFNTCYGLETVSLRYFNVFGPRQDPHSPYSAVIPLFIDAILAGQRPTIYGDGQQARDFTYVENVVRANILAATAAFPANGHVYNVACGESYTLLELLDGINAALGTQVEPIFAPARVGDVRLSKADIARAQNDFGYHMTVPFREGLKKTVDWYRTHPKIS